MKSIAISLALIGLWGIGLRNFEGTLLIFWHTLGFPLMVAAVLSILSAILPGGFRAP